MKRYRVIEPNSSHRHEVGLLLDKEAVRERHGNNYGRDDGWYDYWDVLLSFSFKRDDAGCGFLNSEVQEVR